jgi:hypothetical protein
VGGRGGGGGSVQGAIRWRKDEGWLRRPAAHIPACTTLDCWAGQLLCCVDMVMRLLAGGCVSATQQQFFPVADLLPFPACLLVLPAFRCHMVLGYVVPRSQVAFTPPTQEGAQLAWAYAGAAQYLVYGLK